MTANKRFHYRFGWPLGSLVSKLGIPTSIQLNVVHDREAGVFVGTSPDVRGLVVEAETLDDVLKEASALIPDLLNMGSSDSRHTYTDLRFHDRIACA